MKGLKQGQWLRIAGVNVVLKEDQENAIIWKTNGQCSRGDSCSFRHDENKFAKSTPKSAPPSEAPTEKDCRSTSRRKSLRGRSPSGKSARQSCRDYIKGKCTRPCCDYWHPPECQFYKKESGCKFGNKCARRVQFSEATLRHANIRESTGPSLRVIQVKNPHQRSPYALKFEDRQEETPRQERCARGDAWRMARSILKLKEEDKTNFSHLPKFGVSQHRP